MSLSLVAVLGVLGLVVDVGWAYWRREACKTAAESAAMATARAVTGAVGYTCGLTVTCTTAQTACPATPTSPPSDYMQNGCLYAKQNGYTNSGRMAVTYTAGTTGNPVTGISPAYWVRFTVSENLPQLFSAILGKYWAQVKAQATAAVFLDPSGACIYGLSPHDIDTILATGSSNTVSSCGIYDNSDSATALESKGGGNITGTAVKVVGNYNITGGGTISPTPSTGQTAIADPFASMPAPSFSSSRCDSTGISGAATPVMPADKIYVICGDIRLTGNQTQTYAAGTYVVKNGGITWNNGHVRGTDVMFYMTGSGYTGVAIAGNEDVQLSAPSSGTYRGVLFFQDRSLPTTSPESNFVGGSTQILNGSLYFPTTQITFTGGSSTTANYTALIGYKIQLKGNSYFTADPNGTHTGLGLPKTGLIE